MRHSSCRSTTVVVALLAAALAACGDDVTDPDALLASAEAEAVMRSARALPSLPELLAQVEPATPQDRATLHRARELWAAGAARDDSRGSARRRLAARYAAPILSAGLTEEQWRQVRVRVDDWQVTAEGMLRHIAMPRVDERLRAARGQLERADRAVSTESRSYHLLLAASELVETTPRFVARALTAEAVVVVARAESAAAPAGSGGGSDGGGAVAPRLEPGSPALERARRLKDWAAQAVQEEDYLLAIQRAYYAIQLAEGR